MSMSRKHFIVLADALLQSKPDKSKSARYSQWERDCRSIAEGLNSFRSNFNKQQFINYLEL